MALDLTSGEALLQSLTSQYGPAQGARLYARVTADNASLDPQARGSRGAQGLFSLTEQQWRGALETVKDSPLNVHGFTPAALMDQFKTLSKDPDIAGWVADVAMDEDHRKVLGWVNESNASRGLPPAQRLTDVPGWSATEIDAALLAVGAQSSESQPVRAIVGANGELDMGGMINAFAQSEIASQTAGSAQGANDFTRPITAAIAGNQLLYKIGGDGRQLLGLDPAEIKSVRAMAPPTATVTPRDNALNQLDSLNQDRRRSEISDELEGINQRLDASVLRRGDPALDATIEPVMPEDVARLESLTNELAGVNENIANLNNIQDAHTRQTNQALRNIGSAESAGQVYGEPLSGETPVERTLTDRIGDFLSSDGPEGSMADGLFGPDTFGREVMEYLNLPVPEVVSTQAPQPEQSETPASEPTGLDALASSSAAPTDAPVDSGLNFAPSEPLPALLSGDPVANFDELRPGSLGTDTRGGPGRTTPPNPTGSGTDQLRDTQLANFANSLQNQNIEDRIDAIQDIRVVDNRRNALAALGAGALPTSAQFQDFAFSQPPINVQSQARFQAQQIQRAVDPLGRAFSDNARDLRDAAQFNQLVAPVAGGLNQADPAYQRQIDYVTSRLQGRE